MSPRCTQFWRPPSDWKYVVLGAGGRPVAAEAAHITLNLSTSWGQGRGHLHHHGHGSTDGLLGGNETATEAGRRRSRRRDKPAATGAVTGSRLTRAVTLAAASVLFHAVRSCTGTHLLSGMSARPLTKKQLQVSIIKSLHRKLGFAKTDIPKPFPALNFGILEHVVLVGYLCSLNPISMK